jgi:pyruvate kinase
LGPATDCLEHDLVAAGRAVAVRAAAARLGRPVAILQDLHGDISVVPQQDEAHIFDVAVEDGVQTVRIKLN